MTGLLAEVTDPVVLWEAAERLRVTAANLASTRGETLGAAAHVMTDRGIGELEVGGQVIYPTRKRSKERTDTERLVSVVAARLADESVDRETGEILPPHEIAERVARVTAAATGGMAPSSKWRSGVLKDLGVRLHDFTESEPGAWTVEVRR